MFHQAEPGKGREKLGFREAVLSSFGFLRTYGLEPVMEDVTLVRYESDAVFVNVYHGRSSSVIGVEIGRLDRPEQYGLDYIVYWAGKQAWEAEGFGRCTMFQVSSREGVQKFVPKVAALVKRYGDPFLSGRPGFYDELQRHNEREKARYEHEQMLAEIRQEADAAWKTRNFARVVELLEPVRSELTRIESGRMAYAERHSRIASHAIDEEAPKRA